MVKITLNENLVPSRHPFIKGSPYSDLTHNLLLARKLIRVAAFLFQLKRGSAVYSGYVNEFPLGSFLLHVLEKGVSIRSARLEGLGFAGELFIDVEDFAAAIQQDLFGGFGGYRGLAVAISP